MDPTRFLPVIDLFVPASAIACNAELVLQGSLNIGGMALQHPAWLVDIFGWRAPTLGEGWCAAAIAVLRNGKAFLRVCCHL